jgi:hypothetical protein
MKALLEFNLPEEREEFELHMKAGKVFSAVWDYAQWLRQVCKHGEPDKVDAEACRKMFYECLTENDVEI